MKYTFEIVEHSEVDWEALENAEDSSCFHTQQWTLFTESIGWSLFSKTLFVKISHNDNLDAYFIGQRIGFGSLSIVASPIDGCGYTQGLCFIGAVSREERVSAYCQLSKWIFAKKLAIMIQIDDWQLRRESDEWMPDGRVEFREIADRKVHYSIRPTLFADLKKTEEDLWSGLHYKSCKYCINKANKLGLKVIQVDDENEIEDFCHIHFAQVYAVCKSKGSKPRIGQSEKRMVKLCKALFPDKVLMLKVIGCDEEGTDQVMSSAIFGLGKGECIYWTGASYKKYQKYCPNELMVWEAMKYIHKWGGCELNFGGIASYKLKFGTRYAFVPRLVFQRINGLYEIKAFAKRLLSRLT